MLRGSSRRDYDFTLANLLISGAGIFGVIDINPPALSGDRAFDLATMLFYRYDRDDIRERLRGRALELTDRRALDAYLAHTVLRQADCPCAAIPGPAPPHTTCAWPGWWRPTWLSAPETCTRAPCSARLSPKWVPARTVTRAHGAAGLGG